PAIVPPIGALADRVGETRAGWVLSDDEWISDELMLDRIVAVLASSRTNEFTEAATRARSAVQPTLDAMTAATVAIYRALPEPVRKARAAWQPISAARCLAALHYAPWCPPQAAVAPAPPPQHATAPSGNAARDPLAHVARAALRIRHTRTGRALYRLAPASLLAALKSRLPR
ncbi:MAG: hypothetical protein ABI541_03525, partial [Betaproteobacteria bacterium]